ncbi:DUF3630 family protein [Alteromonas gilva]|uniref:DUF3630 family protein n=1 Tax=Alteromonas gilva TaxID=2987522 RepID=A0ABT5KXV3_9ALTE|nr:DUF3630 family protein [Alteromonas gilva]MDC8829595.1 DUF3630 family protein [Alteromonas gilva]
MQQLTQQQVASYLQVEDTHVSWQGPMPETQQAAVRLCHAIARLLQAQTSDTDWGADRMQVKLHNANVELLLNVEWLCEAVWLQPVGISQNNLTQPQMLHVIAEQLNPQR